MNEFSLYLKQIGDHLEAFGTSWCLIGGLAVGARTDPRFTKDIDLAVSVATDEDSENLVFALQAAGYRISAILEQTALLEPIANSAKGTEFGFAYLGQMFSAPTK